MKIIIYGAGGVGSYFGSRLLAGGHEVLFVARGKHGQALAESGLVLEHPAYPYSGPVQTVDPGALDSQLLATCDAVLLCVKSNATDTVARALARPLAALPAGAGPLLVSLQNGVDNERELADILGTSRLVGGVTRRIGAHIVEPGRIWATGPAETLLGRWPNDRQCAEDAPEVARIATLAAALVGCDIPAEVSPDIRTELWRKLVINNGVNALAALLREETGPIMADPNLAGLVRHLMLEAATAALADGVLLNREAVDAMHVLIATFDSIKPSMLVDRERGREPEIDAICGAVIRRCEHQGLDAPYTRTVTVLLRRELAQDRA